MRKEKTVHIIGWIMLLWGAMGIIANIIFVCTYWIFPFTWVVNGICCLLFIWFGWGMAHWREEDKRIEHEH